MKNNDTASPIELVSALTHGVDGATVRLERRFVGTAAQVWEALTTPERVSRWLAPTRLTDGSGDTGFAVDFGDGGVVSGSVVECEPARRLVVTWQLDGEIDSLVSVDLNPVDGAVVLVLEHRRLPEAMGVGYAAGWHAHTDRLMAAVEGRPLPDWDEVFASVFPEYRSLLVDTRVEPSGRIVGSATAPVIEIQRAYSASIEAVWSAWTQPELLARWLGVADQPLDRVGAVVNIVLGGGSGESAAQFSIAEAVPPEGERSARLVFGFDDPADSGGQVTVHMESTSANTTRVVLRHRMAPASSAIDNCPDLGAGWEGFLQWLADFLDCGRRTSPDLHAVLVGFYRDQRDAISRGT